jgi:hypothetical protein
MEPSPNHAYPIQSHLQPMAKFLQLALWNANDLTHYADELQTFLTNRNTDIMLVSETHFTQKNYLKLPHYAIPHKPPYRNC